jgi:hypothetical protein
MSIFSSNRLKTSRLEQAGRRRRSYIDGRIQGRLVAAIVAFEMLLIVAGMLFLFYDLNHVVEGRVFHVHPVSQDKSSELVGRLMLVIMVIVAVNIMLVAVIEYVWSGYIAKIVRPLRQALEALSRLDLRSGMAPGVLQHEVLDKTSDWIQAERLRSARLRRLAGELNAEMDPSEAKRLLDEMCRCLPGRQEEE